MLRQAQPRRIRGRRTLDRMCLAAHAARHSLDWVARASSTGVTARILAGQERAQPNRRHPQQACDGHEFVAVVPGLLVVRVPIFVLQAPDQCLAVSMSPAHSARPLDSPVRSRCLGQRQL